ncbi:MAG: GGDEF domain-containing protein [Pseudomonadota bacterium]
MFVAVNAAALALVTIWICYTWQLGEISYAGAVLRLALAVTTCVALPMGVIAASHFIDIDKLRRRLLALDAVDDLTGVLKPRFFHLVLEDELNRVIRSGRPSAIMAFEIDRFHDLRDRHGHEYSDATQMQVARIAHAALRGPFDKMGRSSNNRFFALLHDVSVAKAEEICERVRQTVSDAVIYHDGVSSYVTLSIGYSTLGVQAKVDEALDVAETGLEKAKRFKGNKTCNGRF